MRYAPAVLLLVVACGRDDATPEMADVRRLMAEAKRAQADLKSLESLIASLAPMKPYKDPLKNEKLRSLSAEAIVKIRESGGDAKKIEHMCISCHAPLGYAR